MERATLGQTYTRMSHIPDPIALDLAEQKTSNSPLGTTLYAQLLDAVQHSIVAIDREHKVIFWNEYATRLFGYCREEVLGLDCHEATGNLHRESSRPMLDTVWAGQPWTGEHTVLHRNGARIPSRVHAFPIFDVERRVTGIVCVCEDISAEVAARRALHLSQERYDLIARSTADAVWDWEVATDTLWSNSPYDHLVGPRRQGETAYDAWLRRVHPADRDTIHNQFISSTNKNPTFANQYRFLSYTSNHYVRIADRGFLLRDDQGSLLRVVGSMTDISHVTDIEQAFRASEDRFRLVFEESPLGIIIFNYAYQIVQTNAAYRRMVGYAAEALYGHSILAFTHEEDQPSCRRLMDDLFHVEQTVFRVEKRYVCRDGSIVWAAVTATILPARGSTEPLGLALIEDITEQHRVREELSAAKAKAETAIGAKMRFLAQISHEIRSPLNGVLGMLELLEQTPLQSDQLDHLTAARQAATSLLGMLEEILDLTRLDERRLALHPQPYAPAQLVHDIVALYRVKAAANGVHLSATISPDVPALHVADPSRVRQILINLIDNALKFTSNGEVTINLDYSEEALAFTVADTGIGIPADCIDSVFETFSPISAHTAASVGGTGLGLSISRRLARAMGGEIAVASRLGEGSSFCLTLPLSRTGHVALPSAPSLPDRPEFPGRHILIVEDNHINQRVVAGILRRLHCKFDTADNGVEALKMALANRYDAIIMDAMMPVMDGFEATAEIRRREPAGSRVPVVGLTALASEEDRLRCLAAGMDDYLPKPTDFLSLATVLSRWI